MCGAVFRHVPFLDVRGCQMSPSLQLPKISIRLLSIYRIDPTADAGASHKHCWALRRLPPHLAKIKTTRAGIMHKRCVTPTCADSCTPNAGPHVHHKSVRGASFWIEQYAKDSNFHLVTYLSTLGLLQLGWCWGVGTPVWRPESDLGYFVLFAGMMCKNK